MVFVAKYGSFAVGLAFGSVALAEILVYRVGPQLMQLLQFANQPVPGTH